MEILVVIGLLALLVTWLHLEFKEHNKVRTLLGILCVVLFAVSGWLLGSIGHWIIEGAEDAHLSASFRELQIRLENGDVETAKAAVTAYNTTLEQTEDSYQASQELWLNLNP